MFVIFFFFCFHLNCQNISDAFNKVSRFFVQAFKIVIDIWKFSMLLCYVLVCRFIRKESQRHNDKGRVKILKKIYLFTLFVTFYVWEGVGDRTELQYIDPHSSYLPTPPLGQDMTQGQFLSLTGFNSEFSFS